jgi:SP family general alpha glucoside:H+ symporter-like MFS transporter
MIQRLSKKDTNVSLMLESIVKTNEEEKQHTVCAADVSFLECFRGTNWRRTRIILYANGPSASRK